MKTIAIVFFALSSFFSGVALGGDFPHPSELKEHLKKMEAVARISDRLAHVEKKLEEVGKLFLPLEEQEALPHIWEKLLKISEKLTEIEIVKSPRSPADQKLLQEIDKTLELIEQELERYLTLQAPKG